MQHLIAECARLDAAANTAADDPSVEWDDLVAVLTVQEAARDRLVDWFADKEDALFGRSGKQTVLIAKSPKYDAGGWQITFFDQQMAPICDQCYPCSPDVAPEVVWRRAVRDFLAAVDVTSIEPVPSGVEEEEVGESVPRPR